MFGVTDYGAFVVAIIVCPSNWVTLPPGKRWRSGR